MGSDMRRWRHSDISAILDHVKWQVTIAFLAGPALAVWSCVGAYLFGYFETWTAFTWCYDVIGYLFLALIMFLLILMVFFQSLWKKAHRVPATGAVLAFVPLTILTFWVLPHHGNMIVYGLRDRTLHDYTLKDLRTFAQAAKQNDLVGEKLSIFRNEDALTPSQRAAYNTLRQKYKFLDWLGTHDRPAMTLENDGDPNFVKIAWGGTLTGRWGFSIMLSGKLNDSPVIDKFPVLARASDDIVFYFYPD